MSFSTETKNELSRVYPPKKCCQLAEIAGFLRVSGSIRLAGGGKFRIVITTDNPAVARHYKKLIKDYFQVDTELELGEGTNLKKGRLYMLTIGPEMRSEQILRETGILLVREGNNYISDGIYDDLIREYGVDLVLQGHEHNYGRMTVKTEDGDMTTPVYLVSNAAPKNYRLMFNEKYDRLGTNHRFYQNISVSRDTLSVQAFLDDGSLYDDIRIVKDGSGKVEIVDNARTLPEALEMPGLKGDKAEKFKKDAEEWKRRRSVQ